jgi:hypothetical protein
VVDASPKLKLMERANDVVMGRIFDEQVTPEYVEEGYRAAIAYLQIYIPDKLPPNGAGLGD